MATVEPSSRISSDSSFRILAEWEYCIVCGEVTKPYRRLMGLRDKKLGAIHEGRCYMYYLRMKSRRGGEIRGGALAEMSTATERRRRTSS
jgi:hypothetical protein